MRLLCLVAFALCFSGMAHAQNLELSVQTTPRVEGTSFSGSDAGNTQNFTLILNRPATQALTVRVATNEGTGTNGAIGFDQPPFLRDYTPLGPAIRVGSRFVDGGRDFTIPQGQRSVNVDVILTGDRSYEFNENYSIDVFFPRFNGADASGVVDIVNPNTTAQILDDDVPPRVTFLRPAGQLEGNLRGDASDPTLQERTAVPVSVNVDVVAGRPLQLQFDTIDNSTQAGAGTASGVNPNTPIPPPPNDGRNPPDGRLPTDDLKRDYESQVDATPAPPTRATNGIASFDRATGLANILPGTSQFIVNVIILGDRVYEGDEAFTLRLRYSPSLANTVPDSTIITIIDDDLPSYRIGDANLPTSVTNVGQATANEGSNISFLIQ